MVDPEPYELLARALRSQTDRLDELARQLGIDRDPLRAELARLESRGFLTVVDDVISYRRPDVAVADATTGIL